MLFIIVKPNSVISRSVLGAVSQTLEFQIFESFTTQLILKVFLPPIKYFLDVSLFI